MLNALVIHTFELIDVPIDVNQVLVLYFNGYS